MQLARTIPYGLIERLLHLLIHFNLSLFLNLDLCILASCHSCILTNLIVGNDFRLLLESRCWLQRHIAEKPALRKLAGIERRLRRRNKSTRLLRRL